MNPTTIFLQSLLVKYERDPAMKKVVLDFIKSKINEGDIKEKGHVKKYNMCSLFKKKCKK